jgi:hypothetical protein
MEFFSATNNLNYAWYKNTKMDHRDTQHFPARFKTSAGYSTEVGTVTIRLKNPKRIWISQDWRFRHMGMDQYVLIPFLVG